MTSHQAAPAELNLTRVFDAPRELVFRCMITPEHLTHFWGPAGVSAPLDLVLDAVTSPVALKHFGVDLTGVRLVADDLDWSFGAGEPLSGAANDLLPMIAGRRLLTGPVSGQSS